MTHPPDERSVHVTLVVAASVDGKVTTCDDAGPRFTSSADKALLRRLRGEADAVVLGARTVTNDDPPFRLPADIRARRRARGRWETPIRAVVSGRGSISPEARLFAGHDSPAIVFTTDACPPARRAALARVAAVHLVGAAGRVRIHELVRILANEYHVRRLLLEGGPELSGSFLEAGLIDEVYLTVAPYLIGGRSVSSAIGGEGLTFARILPLELVDRGEEEGEVFLHYRRRPESGL